MESYLTGAIIIAQILFSFRNFKFGTDPYTRINTHILRQHLKLNIIDHRRKPKSFCTFFITDSKIHFSNCIILSVSLNTFFYGLSLIFVRITFLQINISWLEKKKPLLSSSGSSTPNRNQTDKGPMRTNVV